MTAKDHPDNEARVIILSDAQIELIAQRVEDRFYKRIGRKVVEKALWIIGIGVVALFVWLAGRGSLPK